MLDYLELIDVEEAVKEHFEDNITQILANLNRSGQLDHFLELIGLKDIIVSEQEYTPRKPGKVAVIGGTELDIKVLRGVVKSLGINKDDVEFYIGYEEAAKFDFRKLQWHYDYAAVLVGPMPHSGSAKGDFGSVIAAIENAEGYPPVYRMGTNELKITKSNLREKLSQFVNEGILATIV